MSRCALGVAFALDELFLAHRPLVASETVGVFGGIVQLSMKRMLLVSGMGKVPAAFVYALSRGYINDLC